MSDEQRQLVDMIYYRNMTWLQICMHLLIDKNTFYSRKNDIVKVLPGIWYLPDDEVEEVWGYLWIRRYGRK